MGEKLIILDTYGTKYDIDTIQGEGCLGYGSNHSAITSNHQQFLMDSVKPLVGGGKFDRFPWAQGARSVSNLNPTTGSQNYFFARQQTGASSSLIRHHQLRTVLLPDWRVQLINEVLMIEAQNPVHFQQFV
jgi:hypothetical protein